nr:succinate dehydrogenase cytochrome b subunit [Desulfobulbaceae bacterium]
MNITHFFASSVGKKAIMSLTGAMLGLFLLTHLAGNISMFFGRESFIAYAEHLHSLGSLIHLFEFGLLIVFILHVYYALMLFFENRKARPVRYAVDRSSGGSTYASKTMPYTGAFIFVFIFVHLMNFHFTDHSISIADIVRNNLQNPLLSFYYVASVFALGMHTSHGFWSLFQTMGINHPRYDNFLQQGAIVISVIGAAIYSSFPAFTYLFKSFLL